MRLPDSSAAAVRLAVGVALASLVAVAVGGAVWPSPAAAPDVPDWLLVRSLARWDAGWYAEIISRGYWLKPGEQSPVAFFPLYPLLAGALTVVVGNRWLALELVSLAAGVGGLLAFHAWSKRVSPAASPWALLGLALYPFAVYLYGVGYSDGLYLTCGALAFWAVETDRPWAAAALGALGTACRPIAPALVVGLVLRSAERARAAGRPLGVAQLIPAFAASGFLAYVAYLGLTLGDPLAFAHVQAAPGWDQPPGWETWLKLPWFRTLFPRVEPWVAVRLGGHALVTLTALALVVPTFRRLGWGYGAYCALAVGIPAVSSKDFQGLGRYVIAAFPLFLTVALLLADRPKARAGWLGLSAALLLALGVAFGAGAYVS